jgi:GTP-binding protein
MATAPKDPRKSRAGASAEAGPRVARAGFAAGAAAREQIPPADPARPEIAFAGRSNVGKSSLLNMLLARRNLARTSNTPGCTRQINFFDVGLAGDVAPSDLVFVDLPGYGYAKVSKSESHSWKRLLEGYLEKRPTLRAVVILVDARRGVEGEERDLVEFLEQRSELAIILAATKLDKLPRSQHKPALAALAREAGVRVVGTSAETGAGRRELWERMLESCRVGARADGRSDGAEDGGGASG